MKTKHLNIYYNEKRNRYTVKLHDEDGNQIQKTFKSIDDALSFRNKIFLQRHLATTSVVASTQTQIQEIPFFKDAAELFIENVYRQQVKPSTLYNFKTFTNKLAKIFKGLKINDIDSQLWQNTIVTIQERNNLSYSYLNDNISRCKRMYDYFINCKVIKYNPLRENIVVKFTKKGKRRAFTKQEKHLFLTTAKHTNLKAYFIFRFYFETGLRKGELLALQWKDIDFDNHTASINKAVCRGDVNGKYTEFIGETKTKTSVRIVPIPRRLMLVLEYNYNKHHFNVNDFVFQPHQNSKYKWISTLSIQKSFNKIRELANLQTDLTIHCMRHTFASQLLTAGIDIPTVQHLGGWSSPNTLLQIYAHSNNEHAQQAINKVFK